MTLTRCNGTYIARHLWTAVCRSLIAALALHTDGKNESLEVSCDVPSGRDAIDSDTRVHFFLKASPQLRVSKTLVIII